eukprot:scaffold76836_cov71-Cyclotella_meneghiniana.AAC.2
MEEKNCVGDEDIEAYNKLDEEIVELIRSAAAKVGRVDFGYQRSPDLYSWKENKDAQINHVMHQK